MADVEIRGKISVDTGNTQSSVNEMLEKIKQTKAALKDAKVGSEEYKAAQAQLKKQTEELNKTMDQNSGSFGKLKETLGQVVPGLDAAAEGAAGFGKQLWLLVANPIVAIIAGIAAALVVLYKAFASTNDGADKLEQIMSGIGASIDVLRDRVLKVAGAISKFFSGDFKAALEEGRAAVSGIGQEIADEFAAASQATKVLQDLEDSMREITVGRAKLNRDLAQAKETMNNADASFAERRAALNKVRAAEAEQNAKELAQARAEYEAYSRQIGLSDSSDEALDKQAQLKAKLYQLEESSATALRSLNRMDRTLAREEQAKADAERKAREDKEKQQWDAKLKQIKDRAEAERSEAELTAQTIADLSAADVARKKQEDEEKDALALKEQERASFAADMMVYNYETQKRLSNEEVLLRRQQQQEVAMIIDNAMNVFGRQTMAGKALAVANALMNTYSGATDALRAKSTLPSPFDVIAKVANVATVLATGFKQVKAINQVQIPGMGSGGTFGNTSITASAPIAPQQSTTALNAGSIQGVGNAASGGVNRSFVLDADIKSNQERQARIARAARLS